MHNERRRKGLLQIALLRYCHAAVSVVLVGRGPCWWWHVPPTLILAWIQPPLALGPFKHKKYSVFCFGLFVCLFVFAYY